MEETLLQSIYFIHNVMKICGEKELGIKVKGFTAGIITGVVCCYL